MTRPVIARAVVFLAGIVTIILAVLHGIESIRRGATNTLVVNLALLAIGIGAFVALRKNLVPLAVRQPVKGQSPRGSGRRRSAGQTLTVRGSTREALSSAADAVRTLPGVSSVEIDEQGNTLKARTARSWKSYGEEVRVKVQGPDSSSRTSEVVITSEPCRPALVDYGKNKDNVTRIAMQLTDQLSDDSSSGAG